MDKAAVSGYPLAADFDYTFSDGELNEILGFLETQHGQPEGLSPTPDSLALLEGRGEIAGLQFQPHTAESLGLQTPSHSGDSQSGELEVKRENTSFQSSLPGQVPGSSALPQYSSRAQPRQQQQYQQQKGLNTFSAPQPNNRTVSSVPSDVRGPSTTAAKGRERQGHVSHSTVEKQRRDRINSLIDELRDMVPPQSANSAAQEGTGADCKRPKHVVLYDTIQLVRELQQQLKLSDGGRGSSGELQQQQAQDLIRRSTNSLGDMSPSNSSPELPQAPEGAMPASGVVVEQGEGCLYVKVNCKDRRGLLSDLICTLKGIPVEVTTAAITTTGDGYIHDVFQVRADVDMSISPAELQMQVQTTVQAVIMRQFGDKRRRSLLDY